MPYNELSELPKGVQNNVPQGGQKIFLEAFNNAWKQYSDPEQRRGEESQEEAAMRVAWAAVKQKYTKGEDGRWHPK